MKAINIKKRNKSRRIWLPILIIVLAAAGGAGYYYWSQKTVTAAQSTEAAMMTSTVRQGSITISISGSGSLLAGKETNLAFSASGVVGEVAVQVGDVAKKDQVLAKLQDTDSLQADVNAAQQDLITAQQALETLKADAAANLANAQLTLADAEKAVTDAKSSVVQPGWARCDQKTLDSYDYQYKHAKDALAALGDGGGNSDYYLNIILPAQNVVARAKAAYDYCAGYTSYEVSSSQASLSLAEAKLTLAKGTMDVLAKNSGIDPIELATAENKVANAHLALDQAKTKLDGATLKAPFDGTILSVAGAAGDTAGTGTFITVADLTHPLVEFSIDETDMDKLALGEQATVSFDAVPNRTFKGTVSRIDPALVSSGGYQVLKGLIQLDLSQEKDLPVLPKGLNASVEIVQASAENVLLVPVQAVRDLGDGTYALFVVGADGKPKMRIVEVGLQDAASAEIKSGVAAGDVVSTGTTATK